jgi:hypothetical protein
VSFCRLRISRNERRCYLFDSIANQRAIYPLRQARFFHVCTIPRFRNAVKIEDIHTTPARQYVLMLLPSP